MWTLLKAEKPVESIIKRWLNIYKFFYLRERLEPSRNEFLVYKDFYVFHSKGQSKLFFISLVGKTWALTFGLFPDTLLSTAINCSHGIKQTTWTEDCVLWLFGKGDPYFYQLLNMFFMEDRFHRIVFPQSICSLLLCLWLLSLTGGRKEIVQYWSLVPSPI